MASKKNNGIRGQISLDQDVVATIAAHAVRDIEGIASLGKSRFIKFGNDPSRGVEAEVGNTEAAVDVDVVIKYGCDIEAVAEELRERLATEISRMANRDVVEVNINVVDVQLPEPDEKKGSREHPRVN